MLGWLTFLAVIAILITVLKLTKSIDKLVVIISKEVFDRQDERKMNRQSLRDRAYFVSEMQRKTGDIKKR
jgi:hypothetical protein